MQKDKKKLAVVFQLDIFLNLSFYSKIQGVSPHLYILCLVEQVQFAVPGLQDGPCDPGRPAGDTAAPAGPSGEKRN